MSKKYIHSYSKNFKNITELHHNTSKEKFPVISGLVSKGNYLEALGKINAYIVTCRHDYSAWRLLHEIYWCLKDFKKALFAIEQALALRPGNPYYELCYARCLVKNGRYEESISLLKIFYEKKNDDIYVLTALTNAYYLKGDFDLAISYGKQHLIALDKQFSSHIAAMPIKKPSIELPKVISFALWGNKKKYCYGALINTALAQQLLPEWRCRFYVGADVPSMIIDSLIHMNAEIIYEADIDRSINKYMWRFLIADDPNVAFFSCRDTDSRISSKEAKAIEAWLMGPKPFHIMRDHIIHIDLIYAGLWGGVACEALRMKERIKKFSITMKDQPFGMDQYFLASEIWPLIRSISCTHDSYYQFPDGDLFPCNSKGGSTMHVGQCISNVSTINQEMQSLISLKGMKHVLLDESDSL